MTPGEPNGQSKARGRPMPDPGLVWEPGRTPAAAHFGDIYFNRDGGLAETRHVFLDGCGLTQAWRDIDSFTIGELGFGTGRNFLAAWELWRRTRRPGARLHYIAVEGYPLTRAEIGECLDHWPELAQLARGLLRVYPEPQPGFHRLFPGDDDGITLTLLYGDAAHVLSQLEAEVDAWFLDGFAPEKNPAMWSAAVFAEMARLSHAKARLATYSVAGEVRRKLEEAGFEVAKAPGFGAKREMLRGQYRGGVVKSALQPWFAKPPRAPVPRGHAVIIGGGIAGTSTAHALMRRGWRTTIIDRRGSLADEASGNPAGVLMPRLTAAPNLDGRFYAAAWRFTLQALEELGDAGLPLYRDRCGLLHLATDDAEAERQAAIAAHGPLPESLLLRIDSAEASDIAGCPLPYGALYFPQGGWLRPRDFCAALAGNALRLLSIDVGALSHDNGMWRVFDATGQLRAEADVVILANALGAANLPLAAWLPLKARRGQITLAPPTSSSARLRTVLAYGGYMTPAHSGVHCIGATFDWVDAEAFDVDPPVAEADHARNLADLARVLPEMMAGSDASLLTGRAALRCTTLDHLPVVGPMPEQSAYLHDFAELRHGHPWARYPEAVYQPGLYALTGLGARGLVAAPLAAEILAAIIAREPWPLERDLITALHPGRFLVRDLKRRDA
jgi:tRNA 5-methylaminomethyl-2-thiouridine biosynthesis bifunctional protein